MIPRLILFTIGVTTWAALLLVALYLALALAEGPGH